MPDPCSPCVPTNPCYNCGCQDSCNCPAPPIYTNIYTPNNILGVDILPGNCISFSKTIINGIIVFTPSINLVCLAKLLCPLCPPTIPPNLNCGIPQNVSIT